MEAKDLEKEERESVPFLLLNFEEEIEEDENVCEPSLEELEEANRLFFDNSPSLVPDSEEVDFKTLNRIFDGRLACRHLSDSDLLDLRDWHKDLKQMLMQKGDRYTLAIQSIQIDIDKLDRTINFRQVKPKVLPMKVKDAPNGSASEAEEDESLASSGAIAPIDEASPASQNEGTLIVLSEIYGWKTLNVEKLVSQKLEEIEQQKAERASREKIDERLSDAYNGGASPYGYRGTFR